jgi:hypothetical protein
MLTLEIQGVVSAATIARIAHAAESDEVVEDGVAIDRCGEQEE